MFRVGDKVFAKIKGYPEWPAIITEEREKKYKVYFYGTGEVGDVKKDCVHSYLENKHRFVKPSLKKRRPYLAAIKEIETAIASDQNENKLKRRKSTEKPNPKKYCGGNFDEPPKSPEISEIREDTHNGLGHTKSPFHVDNTEVEPTIKIISKDYLHRLIEYAKLLENGVISCTSQNEPFSVLEDNEIIVANAPCGKPIAVTFNRGGSYKNERERASREAKLAEETLSVVESIEKGLNVDDSHIKSDLELTSDYIDQLRELQLVEFLKHKLGFLKREATLVKLGQNVRQHLKLEEAQPKIALKYLEEMLHLKMDGLMLKKQPEVVDLVRKLQKYVGNVKMWDFNRVTLENFVKHTKEIQRKAHQLEKKFSGLFSTNDTNFGDIFSKELEDFKRNTTNMGEAEILSIHSEPGSRQAFFDRSFEKLFIDDLIKNLAKSN